MSGTMGSSSVLAAVFLLSALPAAQAPAQLLGAEFRANTYTTGAQKRVRVASDSAGNFVVVWQSLGSPSQDGSGYGVFGQRYGSGGTPLGPEFQVNTYTTGIQRLPSVASNSDGSFVVVWHSNDQDGSGFGVFGQRYDTAGARLGSEFQVNTYTTGVQQFPFVTSSGGRVVVVWETENKGLAGLYNISGQRFDSSGARLGTEFRVNTYSTQSQRYPAVSSDSNGAFVVVWQSYSEDGSEWGVFGQRYDSLGARQGAEFRVNSYTTLDQMLPAVAMTPGGSFIVAWDSVGADSSARAAVAQRYDSAGAAVGAEFRANTYTTGDQAHLSVAIDPNGDFLLVWDSYQGAAPSDSASVFGQMFTGTASPAGVEFQVNTYTTSNQLISSVASTSAGHFVVVYQSSEGDGSSYAVFGQRVCPALSPGMISISGSNSVCTNTMGGTATLSETGGGARMHQWGYRMTSMGSTTPISSAIASSYQINGADFTQGIGFYYLVCFTTPQCGTPAFSDEAVVIVTNDSTGPTVTPPPALTTGQTLCQ